MGSNLILFSWICRETNQFMILLGCVGKRTLKGRFTALSESLAWPVTEFTPYSGLKKYLNAYAALESV